MISYGVYKLVHLIGVFLVLISISGLVVRKEAGAWRKHLTIGHGVGLLLLLIAGFGLLAHLRIGWPWPIWVFLKATVWVVIGLFPTLLKNGYLSAKTGWWTVLFLASLQAYLATFKPFI